MQHPRVGIVVVNWNGAGQTTRCLRALLAMDLADQAAVVVVDNGSADDSVSRLRSEFPSVDVVALPRNLGYGGGCNAGVRYLRERGALYVWLLNNDTVADSGALRALLRAADEGDAPAILAPKILAPAAGGEPRIWSAGGTLRWPWLERGMRCEGAPARACDEPAVVPWASGCSLFAPVEAFERAGLFDERYFMYVEDVDWCLTARARGIPTVFVPDARVWHGVSRSVRTLDPRIMRYYDARNAMLLVFRHGGIAGRIWVALRYAVTVLKIGLRVAVSPKHRRDPYYHAQTRALWDALRGRWGRAPYEDAPVDAPVPVSHEAVAT